MAALYQEIIMSPAQDDGVPVEVKARLSVLVLGVLTQRFSNRSEDVGVWW
ncbi:hypothetical protein [Tritonibacter multivorans]|nr:hypothetical protein [Tritonibacter multivorans]MDA7421167.1 hypothetical protein [Tritonibacter multivorans]SFD34147.1 hypothetical protein SAMN04488049_111110 [Tritonibacter multivorans]